MTFLSLSSRGPCFIFSVESDLHIERMDCCSGMAPLIRAVLSKLIGDEEAQNIEIIANDAQGEGADWQIKYRHEERYAV